MRKRILTILFVVILMIILIPLPQHIKRDYQGVIQKEGREYAVAATLDYWKFTFLVFKDRYIGGMTINQEGEETLQYEIVADRLAFKNANDLNEKVHSMHFIMSDFGDDWPGPITAVGDYQLNRFLARRNTSVIILGTEGFSTDDVLTELSQHFSKWDE